MINIGKVKRYCKDYKNIEGYEQAINGNAQTWHCHHRFETAVGLTRQQLIDCGLYWNRPACELIFLAPNEHIKLHNKGKHVSEETRQKMSKPKSEETRQKMSKPKSEKHRKHLSESLKGRQLSEEHRKHLSKPKSEEARQRMSEAHKGKAAPWNAHPRSEETKEKISMTLKGKSSSIKGKHKVWDNKELNKFHYE